MTQNLSAEAWQANSKARARFFASHFGQFCAMAGRKECGAPWHVPKRDSFGSGMKAAIRGKEGLLFLKKKKQKDFGLRAFAPELPLIASAGGD